MVTIDDFKKLEIKIGKVVNAEKVEGTEKLLKLEIDFGEDKKTILTGMAEFLTPDHFIGKQIPAIVNLEPRTLKGIESQGMILAADIEGSPVLLHPEEDVPNGSVVM